MIMGTIFNILFSIYTHLDTHLIHGHRENGCCFHRGVFSENARRRPCILAKNSSVKKTTILSVFSVSAPLPPLTFLPADRGQGAAELQARVAVGVDGPGGTLDPGARLEVDRVQRDLLGRGEEGVEVGLAHGARDAVGPRGGADQPAVARERVVDVLADADGARLLVVRVTGVAGLQVHEMAGIRGEVGDQGVGDPGWLIQGLIHG